MVAGLEGLGRLPAAAGCARTGSLRFLIVEDDEGKAVVDLPLLAGLTGLNTLYLE
jgi:hypothetical protein